MLRFLVGEVLAGRGDELCPPLIASRIFERPNDFDSTTDSIVRVEMSKVRRALQRHYAVTNAALRIELPRGACAPVFTGASAAAPASAPPVSKSGARQPMPSLADTDEPVLAVLPFAGIVTASGAFVVPAEIPPPDTGSRGSRVRAFARGLTDQLGTVFTRYLAVVVVSRATTLEEAAAQGARYALEGSVRLVHGTLRVTAKLHDTARGIQVWGNTYDRRDADDRLLEAEDEIARDIAIQLVAPPFGVVHAIEAQERAGRRPETAYDVVLRLPRWMATFDRDLRAEIEGAAKRVLAREPEQGTLLAFAALFHFLSAWTADGGDRDRQRAAELSRAAVAAEPTLVSSHQALGLALLDAGDGRGALAEAEAALSMGGPLMATGFVMALAGAWDRGVAVIRPHMAMLKRPPGVIRHVLALDAYRRGDYAAALAEAEAIATPNLAWDALDRAVAFARLDRLAEARAAAAELTAVLPEAARDPRAVVDRLTADMGLREELLIGLRLAGLE
ncbi:Adenylate cyclase [Minicystis rosea]|nr:Adenylate cyclase [Minicystis rosea]